MNEESKENFQFLWQVEHLHNESGAWKLVFINILCNTVVLTGVKNAEDSSYYFLLSYKLMFFCALALTVVV